MNLDHEPTLTPPHPVVLEQAVLFHGSPTPAITVFEPAQEDTVGAGLYLATDRAVASGYARLRARDCQGAPVLYEVEIARARLADLTDQDSLTQIMAGYRRALLHEIHTVNGYFASLPRQDWSEPSTIMQIYWHINLDRMITTIDRGVTLTTLKSVTQCSGEFFAQHLRDNGFDGVLALEGGEGGIGNHHSVVIFDPHTLTPRAEHDLTLTDPTVELAAGLRAATESAPTAVGAPLSPPTHPAAAEPVPVHDSVLAL